MKRILITTLLLTTACGGTPQDAASPDDEATSISADDLIPRVELIRAELTTAVDEKRFRAAAPPSTEFTVDDAAIYMVGRLKRVPPNSRIEVHWYLDASPEPLLVSEMRGSDRYQLVASFQPAENKFMRGSYTAKVLVNGENIGSRSFQIRNEALEGVEPKINGLKFSSKVNRKMGARRPATQFRPNSKKVWLSFNASGFDRGEVATIEWRRGEEDFHTEDLKLDTDRRYGVHIQSAEGLPVGKYNARISIRNEVVANGSFHIGKVTEGPTLDALTLGLELRDDNMPKKKMRVFERNVGAIQCGLRFLDLPPDALIEVQWIHVQRDEETIKYRNRQILPAGGSGTMGMSWELPEELNPGKYKTVVLVNDEPFGEAPFEIK